MIIKGICAVLFLGIMPIIIGLIITKFLEKEKNNIFLAYIIGILIQFATLQLIGVLSIFAGKTLTSLINLYVMINVILAFISIILNITRIKELLINPLRSLMKFPKLLTLMVIILIGLQVYGLSGYMHLDGDDAFYVATSVTDVQTDSLYKYAGTTGSENAENKLLRYRLGPFPVYYSVNSVLMDIHPTIFAHVVMPILFIPISYIILGLIVNCMFKRDKEKVFLFLLFTCFLTIWGNYSIRNTFTFLLLRIWQGKAILANIIIPSVWLMYFIAKENEFKFINYFMFFILILAGCLTTTMGIALPTLSLMLLVIADELSKIDIKNLKEIEWKKAFANGIKALISCFPAIVYGLIYFLN